MPLMSLWTIRKIGKTGMISHPTSRYMSRLLVSVSSLFSFLPHCSILAQGTQWLALDSFLKNQQLCKKPPPLAAISSCDWMLWFGRIKPERACLVLWNDSPMTYWTWSWWRAFTNEPATNDLSWSWTWRMCYKESSKPHVLSTLKLNQELNGGDPMSTLLSVLVIKSHHKNAMNGQFGILLHFRPLYPFPF